MAISSCFFPKTRGIACQVAVFLLVSGSRCAVADDFVLNTKSFIDSIDRTGLTTGQKVMACIVRTGTAGSENPASGDLAGGDFRLFSSVTYSAQCKDGRVTVSLKDKSLANGKEFFVFTTSGIWDPQPVQSASGKSVTVSYGMKGQPNVAGNCLMSATKARSCTWIWHQVAATFSCNADHPAVSVDLKGSDFPSHRLWVNGKCGQELAQKSFDSLWHCQTGPGSDPEKVVGHGSAPKCHN